MSAGLAVAVSAPKAAGAATLSWTFSFLNGLSATLNVTANGADPITPGISYSITGITGIKGIIGGFNISTTTPIAYNSASNLIQISNPCDSTLPFWTNSDGFSFSTDDPSTSSWIIFTSNPSVFNVPDSYNTTNLTTGPAGVGTIIVAGPAAPIPAPGPLPIFGACAAFGISRRLRRRVLTSGLR
jgi:hypothetical protein